MDELRQIPSVERLLQTPTAGRFIREFGRPLTLNTIQQVLETIRHNSVKGKTTIGENEIFKRVQVSLKKSTAPRLVKVINATGVILHTNLGRAPLSESALRAIAETAGGYSNLEFDLVKGERGSRSSLTETMLVQLTGAEAALVVNNNAAAVLLVLSVLTRKKRVIISRTQLVEIGGGFRVPDVMAQSGAKLVEVGATNRVHLTDYQAAFEEPAVAILRAHHSNFKIIGFTSEPDLKDLASLAHEKGAILIDDLGSGALLETAQFGLVHEPTVQESIQAGADLVCFSGDKLLGGPQAGIIVGKKELIVKISRHPLMRAARADKLCLAAMQATLLHYIKDEAETKIPIWKMIAMPVKEIKSRANTWKKAIEFGEVIPGFSTVGGGSLPEENLPTFLLQLCIPKPNQFAARLRNSTPAILARVEKEGVVLDPRTVLEEQDEQLIRCIKQYLNAKDTNH